MDWKETVTTMSGKVFPGLNHKIDGRIYGNEVMSNLPLQMSLYFNIIFVPFWISILILYLVANYNGFSEIYKFITITILSTIFVVELLRIYLGYKGNLEDKIPELAGFWMLSLLLQFPLQGFLLFNPHFRLQLISSYNALKYTAGQQSTYFRIMKLRADVTLSDIQDRYKIKHVSQ